MTVRWSGVPEVVRYEANIAAVWANNEGHWVPHVEADKALSALRSTPPRWIQILEGDIDDGWEGRTVRVIPVNEVKARGKVCKVWLADDLDDARAVVLVSPGRLWSVTGEVNARFAAKALAEDAEVEIVSTDGGPDTLRPAAEYMAVTL